MDTTIDRVTRSVGAIALAAAVVLGGSACTAGTERADDPGTPAPTTAQEVSPAAGSGGPGYGNGNGAGAGRHDGTGRGPVGGPGNGNGAGRHDGTGPADDSGPGSRHETAAPTPGTGPLTEDEVATLRTMLEEERLAHDLYVLLGDKWGARQFTNIAGAETRHRDMVAAALEARGLGVEPATTPGVYTDPALQRLYDDWAARGVVSREEAFAVGRELEEKDIADLEAAREATGVADLDELYAKLIEGSRNHLEAFRRG